MAAARRLHAIASGQSKRRTDAQMDRQQAAPAAAAAADFALALYTILRIIAVN